MDFYMRARWSVRDDISGSPMVGMKESLCAVFHWPKGNSCPSHLFQTPHTFFSHPIFFTALLSSLFLFHFLSSFLFMPTIVFDFLGNRNMNGMHA